MDKVKNETLISWVVQQGKTGIKRLPQMAGLLLIQIGIVLAIQLIFWYEGISDLIPDIIRNPIIFLTATYNDIVPKTLYWIIIFTFGKKLFDRIRKTGFKKAMRPILWLIPEFKKTLIKISDKSYSLLLMGGGLGLIIANNFASYSRFSGARNKFDKYFIALLISFTVAYILGEGRKHWIFKFFRLGIADISRIFKIKSLYIDDYTYLFLSGFIIGLILDAPIIIMKMPYGGYYAGGVLLGLSIVIPIVMIIVKKVQKSANSKRQKV